MKKIVIVWLAFSTVTAGQRISRIVFGAEPSQTPTIASLTEELERERNIGIELFQQMTLEYAASIASLRNRVTMAEEKAENQRRRHEAIIGLLAQATCRSLSNEAAFARYTLDELTRSIVHDFGYDRRYGRFVPRRNILQYLSNISEHKQEFEELLRNIAAPTNEITDDNSEGSSLAISEESIEANIPLNLDASIRPIPSSQEIEVDPTPSPAGTDNSIPSIYFVLARQDARFDARQYNPRFYAHLLKLTATTLRQFIDYESLTPVQTNTLIQFASNIAEELGHSRAAGTSVSFERMLEFLCNSEIESAEFETLLDDTTIDSESSDYAR